jgi:hypothetical protein
MGKEPRPRVSDLEILCKLVPSERSGVVRVGTWDMRLKYVAVGDYRRLFYLL